MYVDACACLCIQVYETSLCVHVCTFVYVHVDAYTWDIRKHGHADVLTLEFGHAHVACVAHLVARNGDTFSQSVLQVPIITQKIQQFEAKKKGKKVLERALLTWIWRRRIRKLKVCCFV